MIRNGILLGALALVSALGMGQTVDFSFTQVCYGTFTTLTNTSTYNDTLVNQWYWDLDADGQFDDDSGQVVTFTFATADTNMVGLMLDLIAGGGDSLTQGVVVNPAPDVNFHVDNPCRGDTAIFISSSTISNGTIANYAWDYFNDSTFDDLSDSAEFEIGANDSTFITLLQVTSDLGCIAFATKTVTVYDRPSASFSIGTTGCAGEPIWFTNGTTLNNDSISYYLWDYGDGDQDVNTAGGIGHTYDVGGVYNVSLIAVSENNCKDTAWNMATINAIPGIMIHIMGDSVFYQGESTTLHAMTTATSYLWNTGDTSEMIDVAESGIYIVTVTSVDGCTNSDTTEIIVNELGNPAEVENTILTPNGDGFNDFLLIKGLDGYDNCSISIYNRWNQLVFENGTYANDWSGTDQDSGTYFYVIQCDDQEKVIGTINILR